MKDSQTILIENFTPEEIHDIKNFLDKTEDWQSYMNPNKHFIRYINLLKEAGHDHSHIRFYIQQYYSKELLH